MKKSVADTKSAHRKKAGVPRSPLVAKRAVGETGSSGGAPSLASTSSSSRLRHVNTSDSALSAGQAEGGTSDSEMADMSTLSNTVTSTSNGGSLSDAALEDMLDSHDGHTIDPQRTKAAIHHLQAKIHRTMEMISAEQAAKEENVNEYLRLSANADKQQQQRIKTVFEKRNQKSTQSIAQLQRKLEGYQKRLKEVETYGVSGHKQAKEVLRDVGQGLKDVGANIRDGIIGFPGGVVDNIRGAKDTIVSKPKEFAHLIKNKFGSADNINSLTGQLEESQGSTDDGEKRSQHGSGTLPASFKYQSDDEASSITSGSGPSGAHSSPRPQSGSGPGTSSQPLATHLPEPPRVDIEPILLELQENREAQKQLKETIESLKTQMQSDIAFFKQALEEESSHAERLEMQINDLTELHQHEVTNIKQELSSMEEKMEYQLEERTRDMQELLETCQTRITKMELQQQQQQLISMEGIENSNFRALLTKLINVVLALLAVVLVFVSTVANLLGPFLTTRLRILSTICLVAAIVATWQHWSLVRDLGSHVMQQYRHVFPAQ